MWHHSTNVVWSASFSVVFKELMLWIKQCVEEAHTSDAAYHPGKVLQMHTNTHNDTYILIL